MDDVVAVVPDLFFQSRISAAARRLGRAVRYSTPDVEGVGDFRLALVDLDASPEIVATIRQLRAVGSGKVVAFGPHVDTERRKLARQAGADRVLAKSKFVTDLAVILGHDQDQA